MSFGRLPIRVSRSSLLCPAEAWNCTPSSGRHSSPYPIGFGLPQLLPIRARRRFRVPGKYCSAHQGAETSLRGGPEASACDTHLPPLPGRVTVWSLDLGIPLSWHARLPSHEPPARPAMPNPQIRPIRPIRGCNILILASTGWLSPHGSDPGGAIEGRGHRRHSILPPVRGTVGCPGTRTQHRS